MATYDIVETQDTVYVVGGSIDAPALRDRLRESGLLSNDEACDLAKHLLFAIWEAHAGGLVHGWINPSNVFVFTTALERLRDLRPAPG